VIEILGIIFNFVNRCTKQEEIMWVLLKQENTDERILKAVRRRFSLYHDSKKGLYESQQHQEEYKLTIFLEPKSTCF
jgi:hypothetical protein